MIDKNRAAARKTIVEKVRIEREKPTDSPYHKKLFQDAKKEPCDTWVVWLTTRTGLMPAQISFQDFFSEEEARKFAGSYPIGSEVQPTTNGVTHRAREIVEHIIDDGDSVGFLSAGDTDLFLPLDVLHESGIFSASGIRISQEIIDSLGKQRVETLENRFPKNWEVAAIFEYCWLNLPHSSPAYIAAASRFHYFVTQDDFSSGYLLRDLEVLVAGVEAEATKSIEMRKKAGEKGRESSARARKKRIEALMGALENVAERNPDIASNLGPKSLLAIAIPEAAGADPSLWTQGQGQAEEYLGEIRRGEAGKGLQSRYQRLFTPKTA